MGPGERGVPANSSSDDCLGAVEQAAIKAAKAAEEIAIRFHGILPKDLQSRRL